MTFRNNRRARGSSLVTVALAVTAILALHISWAFVVGPSASSPQQLPKVTRRVGNDVVGKVSNDVKTVAEAVADFWKYYPGEPLLPMFRPYVMDLVTQAHLSVADSRFKYDAVWALGLRDYFLGLMGAYDRMVREGETEKIWISMCKALGLRDYFLGLMGAYDRMVREGETEKIWISMCKALDLDPEEVKADAEATRVYAKATKPAELLGALERTTPASEPKVAAAFEGISKSLFTNSFAIGLFRMMEESGIELKKANVEEWCKALGLKTNRSIVALDTYLAFKKKLEQALELIREMEIREKKQLAARLEERAKALAAKADEKKAEEVENEELVAA